MSRTIDKLGIALDHHTVALLEILANGEENIGNFLDHKLMIGIDMGIPNVPLQILNSVHYNPTKLYDEIVCKAAKKGRLDILQVLRNKPMRYNVDLSEPFIIAARQGYLDIVKYLYENRSSTYFVDPSKFGNIAIRGAAENGHLEIVEYLLNIKNSEPRVDPADGENDALEKAAKNGHKEIVELLLQHENVQMLRNPPAIQILGELDEYQEMFYRPTGEKNMYYPVYVADRYKNRAYELALRNGHVEIAKLLKLT